jgi:hypothetical protein
MTNRGQGVPIPRDPERAAWRFALNPPSEPSLIARHRHEICLAAVLLRVDRGRIGIVNDVVAFGD